MEWVVRHYWVLWNNGLNYWASRLPTLQVTTVTYSGRYLETFHCSSAVSGWWSIATRAPLTNLNYKSPPDIILVKSNILTFHWAVGEDSIGSDHLLIDIIIESNNYLDNSINLNINRPKLFLAKLDKHILNDLILYKLSQLNLEEKGSHLYEKWYNIINESVRQAGRWRQQTNKEERRNLILKRNVLLPSGQKRIKSNTNINYGGI